MRHHWTGMLTATLVLALPGASQGQQGFTDGSVVRGTLSFDASATLGDFTGTTDSVRGEMAGGTLGEVRGYVEAPVASLRTGNGRRDRDLNKSMETEQYPAMRFELEGADLRATRGDTLAVKLRGKLTLHGTTRQVDLPATLVRAPGQLQLRSDFPLNVKDYNVGGLSKMLGLLSMNPNITVHVALVFTQQPGS